MRTSIVVALALLGCGGSALEAAPPVPTSPGAPDIAASYDWPNVPLPENRPAGLACYSLQCPCDIAYADGHTRLAAPLWVSNICGFTPADVTAQADTVCAATVAAIEKVTAECRCSSCVLGPEGAT